MREIIDEFGVNHTIEQIILQIKDPAVEEAFHRFVDQASFDAKCRAIESNTFNLTSFQLASLRSDAETIQLDGRVRTVCKLIQKSIPKFQNIYDEIKKEWVQITIWVIQEIEECFETPVSEPTPTPNPEPGPPPPQP
jgi:hypothetical protein